MARPLRIEYPGACYHILNRGNAGENVFPAREDKERFLVYLGETTEQFGLVVHAYCVMSNHYHLLIQTSEANLSSAMQWLNVTYAVYFNRHQNRRGHVFGGRFKAYLVDADAYLTLLSRYIHLNPVRAKMVSAPGDYPWSSYAALVGEVTPPSWLETAKLWSYFGDTRQEAVEGYRQFVQEAYAEKVEDPRKKAVAGFILGGERFVKKIQETFLSGRRNEKDIPQLAQLRPRVSPEDMIRTVAGDFDCETEHILTKGRKRNTARDVAIFLSRQHSGVSSRDLGKTFGGISGSAISERSKMLRKAMERDKPLRERVEKIQRLILDN